MAIYLEYWGLREPPFEHVLNEKFFYASLAHQEALSRLTYAVRERKPLALLSGEYGTGKTMACQALKASLPSDAFKFIHIPNPLLSILEILGEMLRPVLETTQVPSSKGEMLRLLKEVFIRQLNLGKHNVVVVDEAHLIEDISTFNELRMLLNYQHRDKLLLSLIFVGQSDLQDKISRLPALRQRIAVQYHLKPLQKAEVESYVLHRLEIAGVAQRALFEPESYPLIYAHSKGVPRIINNVCDLALLTGFHQQAQTLSPAIVSDVFQEIPSYDEAAATF